MISWELCEVGKKKKKLTLITYLILTPTAVREVAFKYYTTND